MSIEILMPALSPTMEEGTLAKWLVKEGDSVAAGDLLAEIETDKATMEFEAVDDGIIGKILIPDGQEGVAVNTPIAILLEEGETAAEIPAATASPATETAVKPAEDAPTPPRADTPAAAPPSLPSSLPSSPPSSPSADSDRGPRIFATPLARRIAADKGLDISTITGSGPHGRIIKADVIAASTGASTATEGAATPSAKTAPPAADAEQVKALYAERNFEEVPLDGMRKIIAARLSEAKQTIPHFYLRRDIRIDALLKLRAEMNAGLQSRGIKLSVNDYIIKASALALQDVPDCNAVWAGDRILRLKPSDVAVAVAIDGGLFTPVLRDADSRTLSSLSAEMKDLAERARARRLAPHEYQGGSFAISNLGMFGIKNFDAVINPPHGSILAVGAGQKTPVVDADGQIATATVMSVTLSVDHRVIDGALGAKFLAALTAYLEEPLSMLA